MVPVLVEWQPGWLSCVRCGVPLDAVEAVCVSEWDSVRWVDGVAHADRDVCKENLR